MQSAVFPMTGQAQQRLITSGTPAAFAASPAPGRSGRSLILSLVLILLMGLAVVQAVVLEDPARSWETVGRAVPGVLTAAAAQALVGFAIGALIYHLAPRAGLWVAMSIVIAALYPAAMVWPKALVAAGTRGWLWAPFIALLTLAAFDAIPRAVREAAAVDRARGWFAFRTIAVPLAAPLLVLGIAFLIADGFRHVEPRAVTAAYALLITAVVVGGAIGRSRR